MSADEIASAVILLAKFATGMFGMYHALIGYLDRDYSRAAFGAAVMAFAAVAR
jgi:hypothetical protein